MDVRLSFTDPAGADGAWRSMRRKIRLEFAYEGTHFHGFQRQSPEKRTVQGELERVLSRLTGESIVVYGSGRTDAGVHARAQVAHFETNSSIPVKRWPLILNQHLPPDIIVRRAEEAPADFHARYDAKAKEYRYWIDRGEVPHLWLRRFSWHVRYPLDVAAMREAAGHLVGTHDFTTFSSAKTPLENRVRTLYAIKVEETVMQESPLLVVSVLGNGFLYNMVRIIVGTLVDVGRGRLAAAAIPELLAARDRTRAGMTAPPQGLILWQVLYYNDPVCFPQAPYSLK